MRVLLWGGVNVRLSQRARIDHQPVEGNASLATLDANNLQLIALHAFAASKKLRLLIVLSGPDTGFKL